MVLSESNYKYEKGSVRKFKLHLHALRLFFSFTAGTTAPNHVETTQK